MVEIWDVYDNNRNLTGKTIERGKKLARGEFHLVVHIWIINSKGQVLIQKRASTVVGWSGMWATTGGSALSGENSKQAFMRELKEELGLQADPSLSEKVYSYTQGNHFTDIWLVKQDFDCNQCTLQKEEVSDVKWVYPSEMKKLLDEKKFVPYNYIDYIEQILHDQTEDIFNIK